MNGDRTLRVYRSKLAREIRMANDVDILSPQAREEKLEEWFGIFECDITILRLAPPLRKRSGD